MKDCPLPPAATRTVPPHLAVWVLRLLCVTRGLKNALENEADWLLDALEIGDHPDLQAPGSTRAVQAVLQGVLRDRELAGHRPRLPDELAANVGRLASLLGLSEVEQLVLGFVCLAHTEPALVEAGEHVTRLDNGRLFQVLAYVLDLPEDAVRHALRSRGALARCGLVTVDHSYRSGLRHKLDLLSSQFADYMQETGVDTLSLLRDRVLPGSPGQLCDEDYAHVADDLGLLTLYLCRAFAEGKAGVNALIHGKPGTGKSELVRLLARKLECELLEVSSEDGDGDPISGMKRLSAFRAAQNFFSGRRTLILFDEIEDVTRDGDPLRHDAVQKNKAWLNRILESNPVPAIWLSNSIRAMDNALIRRFDIVLELPVPPRLQREKIIRSAAGDFLDGQAVPRIAEANWLAPAVIRRAADVVASVRDELGDKAPGTLERLINGTLRAQLHPEIRPAGGADLPSFYDPSFLNADADLAAILGGVREAGAARLCLYGPPGTGKTAFGHWLARELGRPLIAKRASDLLGPYVGQTEASIAKAFKEALRDKAVLVIDEVDGFLRDRRDTRQSWEVTQINEMLTQMEAFDGIFVASTNLMDGLDQASLRRFDLKVRFDYLLPEQIAALFSRHCAELALGRPDAGLVAEAAAICNLTPGDFAAIARRNRFSRLSGPGHLLASLRGEATLKEGPRHKIGFV